MKTLIVLMLLILAAGISFNAKSENLDEAVCIKRNMQFTCKAQVENVVASKACNTAREIAEEGCFQEGISCNTVDNIHKSKSGKYICNAVAIGQII